MVYPLLSFLFLCSRIIANTGAPIKAVITPIGNSVGEIMVRDKRSARIKKPLPIKMDSGRRYR